MSGRCGDIDEGRHVIASVKELRVATRGTGSTAVCSGGGDRAVGTLQGEE